MSEVKAVVLRNLFRALHKKKASLEEVLPAAKEKRILRYDVSGIEDSCPESVDKPKPPTPRAMSGSGEARRRVYTSYKCLRPGWGTRIISYFNSRRSPLSSELPPKEWILNLHTRMPGRSC